MGQIQVKQFSINAHCCSLSFPLFSSAICFPLSVDSLYTIPPSTLYRCMLIHVPCEHDYCHAICYCTTVSVSTLSVTQNHQIDVFLSQSDSNAKWRPHWCSDSCTTTLIQYPVPLYTGNLNGLCPSTLKLQCPVPWYNGTACMPSTLVNWEGNAVYPGTLELQCPVP